MSSKTVTVSFRLDGPFEKCSECNRDSKYAAVTGKCLACSGVITLPNEDLTYEELLKENVKLREALGLIARNGMDWDRGWIVDRAENALERDDGK